MKKLDKMGVLVLVAHLIITLAMLVIYTIFAVNGHQVTTIENMLLVIVGYWFGAMGTNAIRPNVQTNVERVDKLEVQEPNKKEVE